MVHIFAMLTVIEYVSLHSRRTMLFVNEPDGNKHSMKLTTFKHFFLLSYFIISKFKLGMLSDANH